MDQGDADVVEALAALQLIALCVYALYLLPEHRKKGKFDRAKACLESVLCERHEQRGTLMHRLRIRKDSFDKLVMLLGDALAVNDTAAKK
jgi:hypothetical protein